VLFPQRHALSRRLKPERILFLTTWSVSALARERRIGENRMDKQEGISYEISDY